MSRTRAAYQHGETVAEVQQQGAQNTSAPVAADEVDVEIKLDESFSSWDVEKQTRFLEGIRLILDSPATMRMSKKVQEGCVKITLRVTREQAALLEKAFAEGAFNHLKVTSVSPIEIDESGNMSKPSGFSRLMKVMNRPRVPWSAGTPT